MHSVYTVNESGFISVFAPEVTGTPYQPGATRVLLLGSDELGKEVTIASQRLGAEMHAADRYEHAPAHQVARHARVLNMSNPSVLRDLILQVKPHFTVPEIKALATEVLVEMEEGETLDATVIPTARAAQLTMNRKGIRRLAAEEAGLPTSHYHFASSFGEFIIAIGEIGFLCVAKPVMDSSGKSQSTLRSPEDIRAAWDYAISGSRVEPGRVIVEDFIDFDYGITLLTMHSVDPETDEAATWFCEPIGHRQQDGDYVESWQPAAIGENALGNARSVAACITNALGGHGIFDVELFVRGDEVWFPEASPYPHDTGMVTMDTQRSSEFKLHTHAALGLPIDVTSVSPGAPAVVYGGADIEQPNYAGLTEATTTSETDIRIFDKPVIGLHRRMAVAVSTADSIDAARERALEAASKIRVTELG